MDFHAKAKRDGTSPAPLRDGQGGRRAHASTRLAIIFAPRRHTPTVVSNTFGLFTVRDYLNAIHLYDDLHPEDIELFEVKLKGNSATTMKEIHDLPTIAHDFTDAITATMTSIRTPLPHARHPPLFPRREQDAHLRRLPDPALLAPVA